MWTGQDELGSIRTPSLTREIGLRSARVFYEHHVWILSILTHCCFFRGYRDTIQRSKGAKEQRPPEAAAKGAKEQRPPEAAKGAKEQRPPEAAPKGAKKLPPQAAKGAKCNSRRNAAKGAMQMVPEAAKGAATVTVQKSKGAVTEGATNRNVSLNPSHVSHHIKSSQRSTTHGFLNETANTAQC